MAELKTLKDIGVKLSSNSQTYFINQEILRQEAIKWIEELSGRCNEHITFSEDGKISYGLDGYGRIDCWEEQDDCQPIIKWIKHFFNITEEELKGE